MSKRFGMNTKSAEARSRKEAMKQINEKEKRDKLEEEFWKDDDKHVLKKQQRKEEKEKKENEKIQRKQQNSKFLEEEEFNLMKNKSSKHLDSIPKKMTQREIQEKQIDLNKTTNNEKSKNLNENQIDLEENPNHQQFDGHSARNIDEAIQILKIDSKSSQTIDLHPEKRLKSAYQTFEERNLPKLKEENPTLRLSQLKQLLKKQWIKSDENPFNQQSINIHSNNNNDDDDDDDD